MPPVEPLVPPMTGLNGSRTCSTTRLITLGLGRGAGGAGFGAVRGAAGLCARAVLFLAAARFFAGFFAALFFAGLLAALLFALVLFLPRRDDAARLDALRERLDDFFFADDFDRLEEDFFDRFLVAMRFSPLRIPSEIEPRWQSRCLVAE